MNNNDQKIQTFRSGKILMLGTVSMLWIITCVGMLITFDFSRIQFEPLINLIFSSAVSFGIFLSLITIYLSKLKKDQLDDELLTIIDWKLIAGMTFGIGLIFLIYGNWIGVIPPFGIGLISLFNDSKKRKHIKCHERAGR